MHQDNVDAAFKRWVDRHAAIEAGSESPIETKFGHALATLWEEEIGGPLHIMVGRGPKDVIPQGLTIIQQSRAFSYRLDFKIYVKTPDGEFASVVVECDGHDFHERTKEQAKHDRSRDRELSLIGLRVLRFTGSEIHADAFGCARETLIHLGVMQYPGGFDGAHQNN